MSSLVQDTQEPLPLLPKVRLALEIALTFIVVRWRMRRQVDVEKLTALLRPGSPETVVDPDTLRRTKLLGNRVTLLMRVLPGDTRCLARSLVLIRLLVRRGIGATLVIGVHPGPLFGAHAWVELSNEALMVPIEPGGQRILEV